MTKLIVNANSHPHLWQLFNILYHDAEIGAMSETLSLPLQIADREGNDILLDGYRVDDLERLAESMSTEGKETFAIGEDSERADMYNALIEQGWGDRVKLLDAWLEFVFESEDDLHE